MTCRVLTAELCLEVFASGGQKRERMLSEAPDGENKKPFMSKVCISADSVPKQQIKPGNRRLNDSFSTLTTFISYLFFLFSVNTQISAGDITLIIYQVSLLRPFKRLIFEYILYAI